jgi:hypothetical protein
MRAADIVAPRRRARLEDATVDAGSSPPPLDRPRANPQGANGGPQNESRAGCDVYNQVDVVRDPATMKAAPNSTSVTAILRGISKLPTGQGADLELEIVANRSSDPSTDFLAPRPGQRLIASFMLTEPPLASLAIGRRFDVELAFVGGPHGPGRAVVRRIDPR